MTKTVLIAGAGIAGPALAFWLKAGGFEPTLIEKAPSLRSGGYVIDFWGHGYDLAESMGLLPAIDRAGYHIRELRIVNDRGDKLAGFGTKVFRELTGGRYVTLPRSELSRLLIEKAGRSGEVIFDAEIEGLDQDSTGVSVQLSRGGNRRFDLVIDADGLHSAVRQLAFGPLVRFEHRLGYTVAAFEVPRYRPRDEDVYLMYGQPGRMLGRVTLRDDRTLCSFLPESLNRFLRRSRHRRRPSARATPMRSGKFPRFCPSWTVPRTSISIGSARSGCRAGRRAVLR